MSEEKKETKADDQAEKALDKMLSKSNDKPEKVEKVEKAKKPKLDTPHSKIMAIRHPEAAK